MELTAVREVFPLASAFRISRGAKTEAVVVRVSLTVDGHTGQGEATPYGRYGETVEGVLVEIDQIWRSLAVNPSRERLAAIAQPGAARNAIDCALWDLDAKRAGVRAWTLAGIERLDPVKTAYTISLDTAAAMAEAAKAAARRPLLKLKIGSGEDLDKIAAVRMSAPRTRLVIDANEALDLDTLNCLAPDLVKLGVKMIEQPLPASEDAALADYSGQIPLCADESLHTRAELDRLSTLYHAVNIKLDKTGGLTEALALRSDARARGMMIMAGCMVATSLSMAPAMIIAQGAEVVDLDGPLLLAKDREPGLTYLGSMISPPLPQIWG